MLRVITRVLIAIVLLTLFAYVIFLNWPKTSVSSRTVDTEITASVLYQEFKEDEHQAENEYLGKVLVVRGQINDKYDDENGAPVIILENDDNVSALLVTLEQKESNRVSKYKLGDNIQIKALCVGLLREVTLTKGIIVE